MYHEKDGKTRMQIHPGHTVDMTIAFSEIREINLCLHYHGYESRRFMNNKNNSHYKIIIIGAGIAGLAACSRLREYGFDPLILEARNRVGGRIDTAFELGVPVSRGAAWIHGDKDNPMTKLAKHFHVHMKSADTGQFVMFDKTGVAIPTETVQKFNHTFDKMLQQAKVTARKSEQNLSLADALSKEIASAKFSSAENDLFIGKLNYFQGYIGADYHLLSALNWDQEEVWPGNNCFLVDTYQPIINGLANNCRLQLNAVVTEIKTYDTHVEVVTERDTYTADSVVMTLPLGVLKKKPVSFDPPLPKDKQQAIQRIGMGLLNVIVMKFPSIFWPKEELGMFFSQFDPSTASFFLNLYFIMKQPILIGYYGGNKAHHLESIADDIHIKRIMENFRKQFGDNIPDPDVHFITRWGSDPYSYGSYSFVATGSGMCDFEALAKPISKRLFFAGEATNGKYLATTHGAYLSGLREAERIKKILI